MVCLRARLVLAALALLAFAGCGGPTPPPASPEAEHHEEGHEAGHGEGPGHHHGHMPPALHEFHEVLAPLWHGDKGPDRVTKTCAQASAMEGKAAAIEQAPAPEHADGAGWKADAGALTAATKALTAECAKEGRPEFEARFGTVHESFEKLASKVAH